MTIRVRLSLWYGFAIAITVGVVAAVVWFRFASDLHAGLEEALAIQVADTRAALMSDARALSAADSLREDPARPGIFTVIQDQAGHVLAASRSAPTGLPPIAPGDTTWRAAGATSDTALYAERLAHGTMIIGGSSLVRIDAEQGQLAGLLLAVGATAAAVSLAGGWFLAGRALRPVTTMVDEAERIREAPESWGRRLHAPNARDEIGRLAATLNRMLDRVEHSVRRQRAFVASASHDLRTPIAALRMELELALRSDAPTEDLLTAIREALGDAERLGVLAEDILGLAAAEERGRPPEFVAVGIPALVEAAAARCAVSGARRAVAIDLEVEATTVLTDRVRVEQAIANLVDNAVRHSPPGADVTIRARCTADGDGASSSPGPPRSMLDVDVLDRGPGVAASAIGMLFVPFGPRRGVDGTGAGLGLATAEAAIRTLGGRIGYRSRPGGGAWFWFRVPVQEGAATVSASHA